MSASSSRSGPTALRTRPCCRCSGRATIVAHLARANEHWTRITDGSPGLVVITGTDAYVTPRWYASKRDHGRVVPTWNYSAVHLSGPVTVHDDVVWRRDAVTRLTNRAIVGVSMRVTRVEAKAKHSQNRSAEDQRGVVTGLRSTDEPGALAIAAAMDARAPRRSDARTARR